MKKITKILFMFVIAFTITTLASCKGIEFHKHNYSAWKITLEPNFEEVGAAERVCECEYIQKAELPVLTDETVWEKIEVKNATCTERPTETYESKYGTVEIVVGNTAEHQYGEWFISQDSTLTEEGSLKRECANCDLYELQPLAVLTDETVWTKVEGVESECDVEGYDIYQSSYGNVKYSYGYLPHNYGEYVVVDNPTYEVEGKAIKTCTDCGNVEELVLPTLNTKKYWKQIDSQETDYNQAGFIKFESVDLEYTHVIDKLVAPYDGKTYSSFAVDANKDGLYINGVILIEDVWSNANVSLDNNGSGEGTAYPFRGFNKLTMVNPETGEITITQTAYKTDEETGELVLDSENATIYKAFVDFESGIIVRAASSSFNYVHVMTPFEIGMSSENANASAWDNALAIQYTFNENTYSIFCKENTVYFNVKFVNETGEELVAKECINANYVYVLNENDQIIEGYVNNSEKLVVVDGYEGTYTNGENTLNVLGYGKLVYNGAEGTYEAVLDAEYTLDVYVNNEYFEVTLNDNTFVANKPMVKVTFNAGEYATVEEQEYNKNIVVELPKPDNLTYAFKGWFYDAECQNPVEKEFKPTTDVTLYANWKEKVVINLINALEGDSATLYLGDGDIIGEFLPKYGVETESNKVFRGWYLDAEFNTSLPEEAEITPEDTNINIYAKWEELPVYYGTYYGTELRGRGWGNNGGKTLTINEDGVLSGFKSGVIISYDKTTQKVVWKQDGKTETYTFYFDEESCVIAGFDNNQNIGDDFYLFSKEMPTNGKVEANYGVYAPKEPGSTSMGAYAQFAKAAVKGGTKNLFFYNNYIYSNVTITDSLGNPLEIVDIKNSKTVVVKDNNTGKVIVAVASKGESFSNKYEVNVLDQYFGTYTNETETIILDGTGIVKYGEKNGTYALALEGSTYQFDVYLENNTEYYQLTLNEKTFTIVKPMVTVNIVVPEGHTAINSIEVNVNIPANLPDGSEEGYVFNGYFLDPEFTNLVTSPYTFTKETTLYAKYSLPAVLTVIFNNGEENDVTVYSVNDVVTLDTPVRKKFAFVGWYTSEELLEETKWENGSVITVDTTLYAKWEEAPAYYNDYTATRIWGTNEKGGTDYNNYTYTNNYSAPDNHVISINPQGKGTSTTSPFGNKEIEIKNYDETTGYLEIVVGVNSTYKAFVDKNSGIIISSHQANKDLQQIFFLNPFTYESIANVISESYWNNGYSRAIEYTVDDTTYSIFVHNNKVYFGVSFKDANGNSIVANKCYNSETVYVYDENNALIAKFGYENSKLNELDGYEGTYSNNTDTIVLNGVSTITLNDKKGTYSKADINSTYTFDVYLNDVYYELTVDKDAKTYTINKPMVTVTFNAADKATVDAVNTNKNIEIELPTPTNDNFVFRGWYLESDPTTLLDKKYVPTTDVTLIAKWDKVVTLTVVYGNGLEDQVLSYGAGDTTAPVEPEITNNKFFAGWFTDEAFTTVYTVGAITENTTIYAKWNEAVAMAGSYYGAELWNAGSQNFSKKLTITPEGIASGNSNGTVTDYNEETGVFYLVKNKDTKYYAVYDKENGIIIVAYSQNKDNFGTDLYIYFNKEINTTYGVCKASKYLEAEGFTRALTIVFNDGTSKNYLMMDNKLYVDVTWEADAEYTTDKLADAKTLTIKDKDGNILLTK